MKDVVIFCAGESYMDLYLEPLFWNNEDGWGSLSAATIFKSVEILQMNLPIGIGVCWMALEDAKTLEQLWLNS